MQTRVLTRTWTEDAEAIREVVLVFDSGQPNDFVNIDRFVFVAGRDLEATTDRGRVRSERRRPIGF